MPFFSRRKSGKSKTKVSKHGSAQEGNVTQTVASEKLNVGSKQSFNGISTTPDLPRKDLIEAGQRPPNSTAKCVANFPRRSRLSKSLPEVLVDDSVLPLFLEFLQKQGAQNVLNFWLAAETFKLSSRDKTLLSYKSRLKLKQNEEIIDNTTMFDVQSNSRTGSLQLEGVKNSSEINFNKQQTLQKCSNDDERFRNLSPELADNQDISKQTDLASSFSTGSQDNADNNPERSTLLNLAANTTINNDNSNQRTGSGISVMHDSVEQNADLPSLDNSAMSNSICTQGTESQCKYSEISNSDINSSNQIEQLTEATVAHTSGNKNEQCSLSEEMFPSKNKELTREESNDTTRATRERRRMSKVMMDDALSIYRHFISLDATQPLGVDETIRREVESNICTENGVIDPDCFNVAQKFAFNTLQNRYFDDFIRGSYYQKHIMDILTSGKVFLADVMYNDSAMFYFMEFMEQEEKSYLLAFWIAVDSFWQELQSKLDKKEYNAEEALEDAMVLYDKYFSMQASNSLGVSDETRIRIENKICREGGPLPNCFEEPMENVLTLLEEVYFPIFLDSSVYMKYLNELFSSVMDYDSDHTSTCADDCSSTASTSETSKLMESLVNDVEAHDDPDEIWQRPHFDLSIGRVNEFGIYEPGIEPQPGKEVLKFGQKMKKFVSGDSDKVKEEMAWKVAKMVLEDVKKQQKKAK